MLGVGVDDVVLKMVCIVLFCFVFTPSQSTITLSATPTITTTQINNTNATSLGNESIASSTTPPTKPSTSHVILSPSITPKPIRTTAKPGSESSGRKFDGLSFFGGIILGAVICLVLLFLVKYYQVKKRSYHSL